MEAPKYSVRICRNPADHKSPITCQPLCSQHIQVDIQNCEKFEVSVRDKIAHLNRYKPALQKMQQRLSSDLLLLEDTFQELRETLEKCQKEIVNTVTQHHEQILDSLRIFSEMEDFRKELSAAKEENDSRQAFLINSGMERSLESLDLNSKLVQLNEDNDELRVVAYPDVNSRVKDLAKCIEIQLCSAQKTLRNLDSTKERVASHPELKISRCDDVGSDPVCMALCRNTSGFTFDESGSIVRSDVAAEASQLPEQILYVVDKNSFYLCVETVGDPEFGVRMLLISTDAQLLGQSTIYLDSKDQIIDFDCDSHRQLLFFAQRNSLTATDLCGVKKWNVKFSEICCVTGNSDKLFVAVEASLIHAISKDSGEEQSRISIDFAESLTTDTRISVQDFMLIMHHEHKLYKLCTITEQLIETESDEELVSCWFERFSKGRENDSAILSLISFGEFDWGLRIPLVIRMPLANQIQGAEQDAMKNLRILLAENSDKRKVFFILGEDGLSCFTLSEA